MRPLLRWLTRPAVRGVLLGLGCSVLASLAAHSTLLLNLENWFQDGCFAFRGKRYSPANILLVGLDDESLDSLKKPLVYTSPELAEVVTFFKAKGAATIGLDVLVPESYTTLPDLQEGKPGDVSPLGLAIRDAGNVVLPEWEINGRRLRPVLQWQAKHLMDPGPEDFGFVNLTEDDDSFVRRQQLFVRDAKTGRRRTQFALSLVAMARGWKIEWIDGDLFLQGSRVPLDDEQKLRINFVGPPGTFKVIPLVDVLAAARGEKALAREADPRGAIVIIGTTARSQQDYHTTPYSNTYWSSLFLSTGPADLMSGSEVHANIAATLLDRVDVHSLPWLNCVILLIAGAVLGTAYARLLVAGAALGPFYALLYLVWSFVIAVAHHFGWKLFCLCAFKWLNVQLEILPMLVLGVLIFSVTFVQAWWTLRRMLGKLKSDRVIEEWEKNPQFASEDRQITVLFADIRDFSVFSENNVARDVVALLNAYFSAVVPVIEKHGGTLNQFVGDGMMVIFGAPVAQEDHPARAVRAAVEMVNLVEKMHEQWAPLGFPNLRIGVGVNTGQAAIGMVGSPDRLDYTAIGHTTNMAARIEAATREFDVDILISHTTYQNVQRLGLNCEPNSRSVKVKKQTVEVHAVPIRPASGTTGVGPTAQV